ncbi:lysylphosphatidylglycerol synthase domain-containing protein [Fibrella forsythiae]|uniref:Flippase-like domain-containing protein n=1 Tax=Fibrella forsythiae TaxID=2817061 RepID=A0ABS3JDV6_9BACT|nr:lysylphosphatidylglycerol synthase domain-containing protein [Fibrella forsythiae]MBO0947641.1 flippase-like domain-containing protein [Fibrella forsythiae]
MPDVTKKITRWAKAATFFSLIGFIGWTLHQQTIRWSDLRQPLVQTNWRSGWAVLLIVLTPLNWSFEALKWQWLVRRLAPLPFGEALNGVLAGLSLSMALPGPLGDTAGRVLSIRAGQRTGAVGAALVAGGMQFYVALVVGTFAWATYLTNVPERATTAGNGLLFLMAGLSVLGVVLNFCRSQFVSWSGRWPLLSRYVVWWQVIGQYTHGEMAMVSGLALLRHLTFSLQLYAAFRLYGILLAPLPLAAGVGVIFLVKTITPAFNWLSDLGVREAAALWVFAPFGLSAPALLAATLTLWFVNIGLPVALGLVSLWRLRVASS